MKKFILLFVFINLCGSFIFGDNSLNPDTPAVNYDYTVFKDPVVQKFTDDYKFFIDEYITIIKTKNFDSMQVLFNEAEIFSLRAQDINQRLNDPEEIEKFVNEMTKLSEKVQYELSQDDY